MKKYLQMFFGILFFSAVLQTTIWADTLITAPLDSRPISIEYLNNLADMAGDEFISAGKESLDYFSDDIERNHFGNSKKVRKEIKNAVSSHNTSDTTVIINTSSYITGGLVGSRCYSNYVGYEEGLKDLYSLITTYTEPTYYLHLVMPRNLPETRNNKIWPDENKLRGLGYFYLRYHTNSPQKEEIEERFSRVTPTEFIMEWSYVENKRLELGILGLTPWERDYINFFDDQYKNQEPYKAYLENYKKTFEHTAQVFQSIMRWQKKGLLNEIVIGNDDFQLPSSIVYFYEHTSDNDWITLEKGSPVKFSFARSYMTGNVDSVHYYIQRNYSLEEAELALKGKSKNINFIFGLDEIPQLIYARDLSKRMELSTNFNIESYSKSMSVESYDVLNAGSLMSNAVNFVSANERKTDKQFDLVLYDYEENSTEKEDSALKFLNSHFEEDNNVGLIEIYNPKLVQSGGNTLFQKLLDESINKMGITNLSSYSAWNTNANAIGLGVAHAQVYGIMEQKTNDMPSFLKAQIKILGQHILEDGIYTGQVKSKLYGQNLPMNEKIAGKSHVLYDALNVKEIMELFDKTIYHKKGRAYQPQNTKVTSCNFPWGRLFDCYIDIEVDIDRGKAE